MNEQTFRRLLDHCELSEAEQGCRDYLSQKFNQYLEHLIDFYIREYKVMNGLNRIDEIIVPSAVNNDDEIEDRSVVQIEVTPSNARVTIIEFSSQCIREIFTQANGFVFVPIIESQQHRQHHQQRMTTNTTPASKLNSGRSQHNVLFGRTFFPEIRKLLTNYINEVDLTIADIRFTKQGRILLINICEAYLIDCINKAKCAMDFRARGEKSTQNMRLMCQDLQLCAVLQNRELRIEIC